MQKKEGFLQQNRVVEKPHVENKTPWVFLIGFGAPNPMFCDVVDPNIVVISKASSSPCGRVPSLQSVSEAMEITWGRGFPSMFFGLFVFCLFCLICFGLVCCLFVFCFVFCLFCFVFLFTCQFFAVFKVVGHQKYHQRAKQNSIKLRFNSQKKK